MDLNHLSNIRNFQKMIILSINRAAHRTCKRKTEFDNLIYQQYDWTIIEMYILLEF